MNYRSAVVVGRPRLVTGEAERSHALDLLVDHVTPGRSAALRRPTRKELARHDGAGPAAARGRRSSVASVTPSDEDVDVEAGGVWAGVVPLGVLAGEPVTGADVDVADVPAHVQARVAALNRRPRLTPPPALLGCDARVFRGWRGSRSYPGTGPVRRTHDPPGQATTEGPQDGEQHHRP